MKNTVKFLLASLVLVYATACNMQSSAREKTTTSGTGQLKLTIDSSHVLKKNTRGINLNSIQYFNITIKGMDFTTIQDNNVPLSTINDRIYTLDVINNLLVVVEPLDNSYVPVMGSAKIYGYGNVTTDSLTTINVNWQNTPVALVLEKLLIDGYDIRSYNPVNLQTEVQNQITTNNINPLAVDFNTIADNIKIDSNYATVNMYPPTSISGNITPVKEGMIVMINDPFVPTTTTDASGSFTLPNVAPGSWLITLSDGGSINVSVNINGTYTPNPANIGVGIYKPAIYKWGVSSLTENGTRKAVLVSHIGDMDGLSDISEVSITLTDGTSTYSLTDNGGGIFLDTNPNDGKYENIINHELVNGNYRVNVIDSSGTSQLTEPFTISYINSTTISSPTDGQIITDRTPTINWSSVTNATSYSVKILQGATIIYSIDNLTTTSHTIPTANELADGTYTLKVFAYNGFTGYRGAVSVRTISFSIQVSGKLSINMGDTRYMYANENNSIKKINLQTSPITETVIYTPAITPTNFSLTGISPNGQLLLFIEDGNLYRIRTNGTDNFMLADPYNEEVVKATWSPDGAKIAYLTNINSEYNLYIINTDGSDEKFLVTMEYKAFTFSKDATKIYCYTDGAAILAINTDGSGSSTLPNSSSSPSAGMELSPNGNFLLIGQFGEVRIYSLTSLAFSSERYYLSNTLTAHWSPDGNKIVAVDHGDNNYHDVNVINIGKSPAISEIATDVSSTLNIFTDAAFSHSGKYIYYTRNYNKYFYRILPDGTGMTLLKNNCYYKEFFLSPYTW